MPREEVADAGWLIRAALPRLGALNPPSDREACVDNVRGVCVCAHAHEHEREIRCTDTDSMVH